MAKASAGAKILVYPMPAFLVGTNVDGKPDFMTAAWGGVACSDPPMISVGVRPARHTMKGIKQNMTLSINIPSMEQAQATDYCGIVSGAKADKVKVCGFNIFYGKLATAPMIEQCPVNMECRVIHIIELGSHNLVISQIEDTHVSEACLTAENKLDLAKVNPLIFVDEPALEYYTFGKPVGRAFNIGKALR